MRTHPGRETGVRASDVPGQSQVLADFRIARGAARNNGRSQSDPAAPHCEFQQGCGNGSPRINVRIVLDVTFLVHRRPYRRRTAVVSSFASKRPSMYSLDSARTSLVGAKSSTYALPILQPFCFHIHACNGCVHPLSANSKKRGVAAPPYKGGEGRPATFLACAT
jgi:hypothetical protein